MSQSHSSNMNQTPDTPEAPKKRRRWWLDGLLILAVFIGVHLWQTRDTAEGPAPELAGALLNGKQIDLIDYRGKPVLVYFWATWCPVCKVMDGAINDIAKDHAVLTVAMQSGNRDDVLEHLRENDLDFPTIVDAGGELSHRWGVSGVPTSFVVDAEGQIDFTVVGLSTEPTLRLRLNLSE